MHPIFEALKTPPPRVTREQATDFLNREYGLSGALEPVDSERDLNFRVRCTGEQDFVLKIANVTEARAVTDFQNEALRHLARNPMSFAIPSVVAASNGQHLLGITGTNGVRHSARLLTWLDGQPLQHVDGADSIAGQTGTCLGELGRALADFSHEGSGYPLLWDIRNASHLAELLPYIENPVLRELCEQRIARFDAEIKPRLGQLRTQVVHNDLNPSNMLVDPTDVNKLAGVIDFGDMVHTQLVNDVAVAAAYFCKLEGDPYRDVIDFLSSYAASMPLTDEEIDILPDMISARHLTTVMITHWRASLYPENRGYILRNEGRARNMLRIVAELPIDETRERFRRACAGSDAGAGNA